MNKILTGIVALILMGCDYNLTPEERAAKESAEQRARLDAAIKRVETLQAQARACDKNDGVIDIRDIGCNRYGCDSVQVLCKDGMSKIFPR